MSNSEISTLETEPVVEAPTKTRKTKAVGVDTPTGSMVMLTVHAGDGDNGGDAVFVGVNGYAYQIPRDTPVKVPGEVVEILKNAVVTAYRQDKDGVMGSRDTPRYAYSVTPV